MSGIILSEKFEKELVKFIAWLPTTDYKIRDIVDNSELEWKDSILTNFEEPGRNKLESYIREMSKAYFITKGEQEVNDVKFMANEFRTAKVKITKKDKIQKDKIQKDKIQKDKIQKDKIQKDTKQDNTKQKETFKISVGDYDTSETFNLDTLDCYTKDLINLFGQPMFFKDETEFQYEWRLVVGTKVFSIYNWKNDTGCFDNLEDCEWYLGGTDENTKEQIFLKKYIKGSKIQKQQKKQEQDVQEQDQEQDVQEQEQEEQDVQEQEIQEQEIQEQEIQEQEVRELDDKIDIELDFIDDENLEINIDDIDFDF
jgi:hypothetical protein